MWPRLSPVTYKALATTRYQLLNSNLPLSFTAADTLEVINHLFNASSWVVIDPRQEARLSCSTLCPWCPGKYLAKSTGYPQPRASRNSHSAVLEIQPPGKMVVTSRSFPICRPGPHQCSLFLKAKLLPPSTCLISFLQIPHIWGSRVHPLPLPLPIPTPASPGELLTRG